MAGLHLMTKTHALGPVQAGGEGAAMDRPPPHLFVVGCPRSGTNLLRTMLDRHPQLALAFDTHFIPRVIELVSETGDPPLTPALVDKVIGYHRFSRLDVSEAAAREAANGASTYGQFVSALYGEYGQQRGKPLVGEKTPDYVLSLPRLHELFPWARFVHLIRDGRDVALSMLNWARDGRGPSRSALWPKQPLAVCALWWERRVRTGRRDAKALDAEYHEARYEEIVSNPREVLQGIMDFLRLPFAEEMLISGQEEMSSDVRFVPRQSRLAPTPGLRNWRAQMKEEDAELFEAIAGGLLSELGYERRYPAPSSGIVELAQQCRATWEAEAARHDEKIARLRLEAQSAAPGAQ